MTAVPTALLIGAVAAGLAPWLATSVGDAFGAHHAPHWTPAGTFLGFVSGALAVGLAAVAVHGPTPQEAHRWTTPLRRMHSGHIGDYVVWLLAGTTLIGALSLPGIVTG